MEKHLRLGSLCIQVLVIGVIISRCLGADPAWTQFRGPNASGVVASETTFPTEIGPSKNEIWKIPLVPGHSSPVVIGNRLYVTGVRGEQLLTLGLDRATGDTLWEAAAPYQDLEKIHAIGSPVQCSPATDGERVVSFFGSAGMFCYDAAGELLWKKPMGPFNNDYGACNSPIIVGDRIIICQDHDADSFIMAVDKLTGEQLWRTDRSEFPRNFCSPILWEADDRKLVVVAASLRAVGYDLLTGKERWTVRGLSRHVGVTPVVTDNGNIVIAAFARGGDVGDASSRLSFSPFGDVFPEKDANHDGKMSRDEFPTTHPAHLRFRLLDQNKDGFLTEEEYERYRRFTENARNVIMSVRPGGQGDVTESHVAWRYTKHLPMIASPLAYRDTIFMVKDGGILTSLDAATGLVGKTKRVKGTGSYYSSPVGADGKVYLVDQRGELTVVTAEPDWKILASADFGEDVYATPALVDGDIYFRTTDHLYRFGLPR